MENNIKYSKFVENFQRKGHKKMKKKVKILISTGLALAVVSSILFANIIANKGFVFMSEETRKVLSDAVNAENTVYNPGTYILKEGDHGNSYTYYSDNIFRADAAYNTRFYDRMTTVEESSSGITVGNVGLNYNNWTRYCAFYVKNGETAVTSKMSTGVNESNNRLVFMAPYSGYYEISPRALSSESSASVALELGNYVSEFEDNTANFKIVNPQTNETYTDITLYATNADGESKFTGEIANTQNIYLSRGEKLYIMTSTSAEWFDYGYTQTVFVKFDLGVVFKEAADMQYKYNFSINPSESFDFCDTAGDAMNSSENPFTVETKYYSDSSYKKANNARAKDANTLIVGSNNKVNWDKYAAAEFNTQTGEFSAKLLNKNSGVKLIYKTPAFGTYKLVPKVLSSGNFLELDLGNSADKFSDNDKVDVTIEADGTTQTITLTKTSTTAELSLPELNLNKGDTITITIETNAQWFDEPEYQTVTVRMNFDIEAVVAAEDTVKSDVYDPYEQIIEATENIQYSPIGNYSSENLIDYSGYEFSTINRYYTSGTGQYAYRLEPYIYTYGKTWDYTKATRGSFEYYEHSDRMSAIMGMSEDSNCVQTLRFTAPSAGYYVIDPIALGWGESAWIKSMAKNQCLSFVEMKIVKNENELLYESGELDIYDSIVWTESDVIFLEKGETIDFNFSATHTTWNTNPKISFKFNISKLDLSL